MATLNPLITGTPGQPPSYNPSVADTFSWIPVQNSNDRPLYARAVYSVNRSDNQGQDGFDFLAANVTYINNYNAIQTIVGPTRVALISATNSYLGNGTTAGTHLTATDLPANFILNGPITGIRLSSGYAIGYK